MKKKYTLTTFLLMLLIIPIAHSQNVNEFNCEIGYNDSLNKYSISIYAPDINVSNSVNIKVSTSQTSAIIYSSTIPLSSNNFSGQGYIGYKQNGEIKIDINSISATINSRFIEIEILNLTGAIIGRCDAMLNIH